MHFQASTVKNLHVLNALRHQRFGTGKPHCRPDHHRCAQRLTASEVWHSGEFFTCQPSRIGAQRLTASEVWHGCVSGLLQADPSAQRLTASEVWHDKQVYYFRQFHRVLNALRHQRFGTTKAFEAYPMALSAQRLTASEVWHARVRQVLVLVLTCSTPYGIRGLALPFTVK